MNDKLKYIVTSLKGDEAIFVFPQSIDHNRMLEAIQMIRFGTEGSWNRDFRDETAISAGFVVDGQCSGYSETLGLKSRGKQDTDLLHVGL